MKLILTRPIDDSKKILNDLKGKDHDLIMNPLLEIVYLQKKININQFTSVLFTSRHSVRALKQYRYNITNKFFFICGKSAYQEALEFGLSNEYVLFENISDLVKKFPDIKNIHKQNIMYLRGRHISYNFNKLLKDNNIKSNEEIIYEANQICNFTPEIIEEFTKNNPLGVFLYSERTAHIFINTLKKYKLGNKTSIILAYCLSKNISQILEEFGIRTKYPLTSTNEAILNLI